MSTRTVDLSPLIAHVPVDRFDIVFGPDASKCMAAAEKLASKPARYAYLDFTLKTAASAESFRRSLKMATISVEGDTITFTAIFSRRVVSGEYNMKTRKGYFNLD